MTKTTSLRLSRMGAAVGESATLRQSALVAEMRAAGKKVYNLTVGEPDCEVPTEVLEAAHRAIDTGHTQYTPTPGSVDLRAALAAHYSARHALEWRVENGLISTGAKQTIWNALAALSGPGDEVVLISPYWTSYLADVQMLGATPRIVRPAAERNFKATGEDLLPALNSRTRVVLFNTPVNPTGVVYDRAELEDLFRPLLDRDIVVVSDEIYERLIYEGEHLSPLQVYPELQDRFLVVSGASKSFAMTGWRIGFGLGPPELIRSMVSLQSHTTGNPNSIAQRAALAALQLPETALEPMRATFKKRRDVCLEILAQLPGLQFAPPQGTFYFFLRVAPFYGKWQHGRRIENSEQLATHLLENHQIAVVAGSAFDDDGCIRLSYTLPEEDLRPALERLIHVLRERI